jgi:predicted MFS family arabinose efflux permease
MPLIAILFLTVVNLLNYFDRYIVQSVEPTITKEFALSNIEAGYVVSAFVLGYCIFSPIFGFIGDRVDRRRVMAFGLLAWSLATALTAVATSTASFIFARILVGVGEACYGSIVPVYLKNRIVDTVKLNRALSIFYVAIPVGSALGYVAGGQVAAAYGWRTLFEWLVVEERAAAVRGGVATGIKAIAGNPFLILVIGGYVLNTFALNGVAAFIVRHGTNLGLSDAAASTSFGVILVVTGLAGTLGGGFLASRLVSRSSNTVRDLTRFVAYTTLLGVPFLGLCFLAKSIPLFLLGCFLAELLIFAGVAPLNSVIVARAPVGFESFTQGVTILSIQLFGGFVGPVFVGALTDLTGSLALALQVTTAALLLSGLAWQWAYRRA